MHQKLLERCWNNAKSYNKLPIFSINLFISTGEWVNLSTLKRTRSLSQLITLPVKSCFLIINFNLSELLRLNWNFLREMVSFNASFGRKKNKDWLLYWEIIHFHFGLYRTTSDSKSTLPSPTISILIPIPP